MSRKVPTHLTLLRGNPGKRAINGREPQPQLPPQPPAPPDFLSAAALEEWKRISVEAFHLKLLTNLDVMPLAAYCAA
jgi:phage terminase small subunit